MYTLTNRLYECYNKKKFGSNWKTHPGRVPLEGIETPGPDWVLALECKIEIMKEFGIEDKMKVFGYTPGAGGTGYPGPIPTPDWPPLPPDVIIPTDALTWFTSIGGPVGSRPTAAGPPPYNPATASACCPPIGCTVIVTFNVIKRGVTIGGHSVAGVITKCGPLTIKLHEHPFQRESFTTGMFMLFEPLPEGSTTPQFFGSFHESDPATRSLADHALDALTSITSFQDKYLITSIICLC